MKCRIFRKLPSIQVICQQFIGKGLICTGNARTTPFFGCVVVSVVVAVVVNVIVVVVVVVVADVAIRFSNSKKWKFVNFQTLNPKLGSKTKSFEAKRLPF